MKKSICGLVALMACAVSSGAMASVVFNGSAKCSWGNAIHATDTVYSIANGDAGGVASINWGVPAETTQADNQFTCNGAGSDGSGDWSGLANESFKIADFSYRNGSTFNGDLSAVDLQIALDISGPVVLAEDFAFKFLVTNTPNETGDPVLDGDIVSIAGSGVTSAAFGYGGVNYTLQLLGFSTDGGATLSDGFKSPEGANQAAGIYAKVTVQEVPEPGTLALVAVAGMALPLVRRRKLV